MWKEHLRQREDSHASTKTSPGVFDYATDLESIQFEQIMYYPWHSNNSYEYGTGQYIPSGNFNNLEFKQVTKPDSSGGGKQTLKKNSKGKNYHD